MTYEKRAYVKRKRARDEEQTRVRIAQAAVDLHGSVGPAFTTISAVADRAGVRRATVYRHFPDENALFAACSSLWLSENPLPDIEPLREVPDGSARLVAGLDLLYGYYRPNARMLANVIRDAENSPALRETLDGFNAWLGGLGAVLRERLNSGNEHDVHLRDAAVTHSLSFMAWRALCIDQRLTDKMARDLMVRMVLAA